MPVINRVSRSWAPAKKAGPFGAGPGTVLLNHNFRNHYFVQVSLTIFTSVTFKSP
jgi:hypothetical protein